MISANRCPWCGYEEKWSDFGFTLKESPQIGRCKSCKRAYITKKSHWLLVISILVFLFSFITYDGSLGNSILRWTSITFIFFLFSKLPIIRYNEGSWYKSVESNNKTVKVKVEWFKYKQGGLIFSNYRIWNGYILPICFVDLQDKPISLMWCIKLDRINRKGINANADMNYVLDDAPEGLLVAGNRFYVFHKKHKIGRGEIIG
ncbi:MAG: hypothetical protein K0R15_1894 [Clostridiales bacterium]|nr:hypothetical protein [Clostridiales bacterium]